METSKDKIIEIAIRDLVKLSVLTNNVVIKGNFPGSMSDEVKELLDMCNHIVSTFTKEEDNERS